MPSDYAAGLIPWPGHNSGLHQDDLFGKPEA